MNIFIGLSQSKSPKIWLRGALGHRECQAKLSSLRRLPTSLHQAILPPAFAETTQPVPHPANSIYSILFSKNGTIGKSG